VTAQHPIDSARRTEIAENLAAVRERIAAAASACGRDPGSVSLIAVSKTYPASDVAHLVALGVPDVGENREQEAAAKAAELAAAGVPVRWHHIGQLQRNKARSVASYAAFVHSVDRLALVDALARARTAAIAAGLARVPLKVLIQVGLEQVEGRGGAAPDQVGDLATAIAAQDSLDLAGVMAVAPLGEPPEPAFARLAQVADRLQQAYPQATMVSAGMSGDLEAAIAYGATHVRVGSALLGPRPMLG
jgi:pyridoxal phosphate enzyme (YggS family)